MYKYIYFRIFGDYLCKTINPNIPNSSPDVACLMRLHNTLNFSCLSLVPSVS